MHNTQGSITHKYNPLEFANWYYRNNSDSPMVLYHKHNTPKKIMTIIVEGDYLKLVEEKTMLVGCITVEKTWRNIWEKKINNFHIKQIDEIEFPLRVLQGLDEASTLDEELLKILNQRIDNVRSNMFEQQDKSSEPSEITKKQ